MRWHAPYALARTLPEP